MRLLIARVGSISSMTSAQEKALAEMARKVELIVRAVVLYYRLYMHV
jgi:hypothetical protein